MNVPIVILHGWGVSGAKYNAIQKGLEERGYIVFAPDLPGFGSNPLQKDALEFEDYIQFVFSFIKGLKVKKVILLGHSFGGRIAIRFTALYPDLVEKLVLTGASGIPHALPLKKKIISFLAKRSSRSASWRTSNNNFFRFLVYRFIGEMDYYTAGPMRETFKNVHKVTIVADLPNIKIPTLLVWGEFDTMIPLRDGKHMHEKIKQSELVVIPGATHKLPYENPEIFLHTIVPFLS